MDCVDDDEWIGNRHVGIGWSRKVVRGKRCRDGNVCEAYVIPFLFGSFFTCTTVLYDRKQIVYPHTIRLLYYYRRQIVQGHTVFTCLGVKPCIY